MKNIRTTELAEISNCNHPTSNSEFISNSLLNKEIKEKNNMFMDVSLPWLFKCTRIISCFIYSKELFNSSFSAINLVFKNYNSSLGIMTFDNTIQQNFEENYSNSIINNSERKYNSKRHASHNKLKQLNGSELNKMNRLT